MYFWDPVIGCSPLSEGCRICSSANHVGKAAYAGLEGYIGLTRRDSNKEYHFNGTVRLQPEKFEEIRHLRKEEQIFVCGRSDLFHPKVPYEYVDKIIACADERSDCTFFAITKRTDRMASYDQQRNIPYPSNFWFGITVENQDRLARMHDVKNVDVIKILSIKPMLGPVDITQFIKDVDMVIVGGETGRSAKPMKLGWVRVVRDCCLKHSVPFSFHGWGAHNPDGSRRKNRIPDMELDGHTWNQFPDI